MSKLETHPAVVQHRAKTPAPFPPGGGTLDATVLRELALLAGADDAGLVDIDNPALDDQRAIIREAFPFAKTLISIVKRMSRESVRSPMRSLANLEFHEASDEVTEAGRRLVRLLEDKGLTAANANMAFPMETSRWPGRMWVVSHKPVAVAAGLGRMGIHRSVIHPRFGSFILLGTVVAGTPASSYGRPAEYNPCLECKLCVAACPTGAIAPDGSFNFHACYTHNYREFMGGFIDWADQVADSSSARDYRSKVSDPETVSMWQSLAFRPNYKAAYCLSVCPAGEDNIGPYLTDPKNHRDRYVRPLIEKVEDVYVIPGSDAEEAVQRRFPAKRIRRVGSGLRVGSIEQFLDGLPLVFQRNKSAGLDATYHFTFTGAEQAQATIEIRNKSLKVSRGHHGTPSLRVTADARTWLRFLAKDAGMPWAIVTGKIRLRGSPSLLMAFGRCFPS